VLTYQPENPAGAVFLCVGSTEETLALFRADTFKLGAFLQAFKLTLEEKLTLESKKITIGPMDRGLGKFGTRGEK
jgi:hypothetical protein